MRLKKEVNRQLLPFFGLLFFMSGIADANPSSIDNASKKSSTTNNSGVTLSGEPSNGAWWVRVRFQPDEQAVSNVPVSSLDPSWRFVSELRKDLLKPEILGEDGQARMERHRLEFRRSGDFNRDGIVDLALVGVYQDYAGALGSFLVVLTKGVAGAWQKAFLKSWPGHAGFLAIEQDGDRILVWRCMECDMPEELVWHDETKRYILNLPKPYQ
jgi:hypothetical protein